MGKYCAIYISISVQNNFLGGEMNRNELSIRLANEKKITKLQSDDIINTVFNIIKEALKEEQKVCIKDFGTFYVKPRKGRQLKDISTNRIIKVPDLMELKLKSSQAMKDYLNDKNDKIR